MTATVAELAVLDTARIAAVASAVDHNIAVGQKFSCGIIPPGYNMIMLLPVPPLSTLCVPYHLGRRDSGMGLGPKRLLDVGEELFESLDNEVSWVELATPFWHEIEAHFAVLATLSEEIGEVHARGRFPLVLGGNCGCAVAAVAAAPGRTGVVWFDAHADAHTPSTTSSGFLEGMPVSILTGRSWEVLSKQIPGFRPHADQDVLLVGLRDMEPEERELVRQSGFSTVSPTQLAGEASVLHERLAALNDHVDGVHLHVDLDVLDTTDGSANEYAAEGGPSLQVITDALRAVADRSVIQSISLTSYNPGYDEDGRALKSGQVILAALLDVAESSRA